MVKRLSKGVNGISGAVLPALLETALRDMRVGLLELSESRFPGLRVRHYRLLGFVPDDGIRVAQVAKVSGLTKQALAQALAPLVEGRYVTVEADPSDRRARVVRRADRGREVLEGLREVQTRYERVWAAKVGAQRWRTTREVLIDLFGAPPT